MTATAQHRAIVQALNLSPSDLRELADELERERPTVLVRDLAGATLELLPANHRYVTSLRRLIAWAGDAEADDVDAAEIAAWMRRAGEEALRCPNARHGVGAEEAFLLATWAAFARAVAAGLVSHNPAAKVELPARPASSRTALSAEQLVEAHLTLVAHSRDAELDDLVWQLIRETGCRRGGAIDLVASALAVASGTIRLVEKYGKDRWLPISGHLMARWSPINGPGAAAAAGCCIAQTGHMNDKWFEGFGKRIQRLTWARELGVTAHWLRHTTLTDIERVAGLRIAGAYAGHADSGFGVTGRYTKPAIDELRMAHNRLFFDDPRDASDPGVPPQLFRRVLPVTATPIEFAAA